MEEYDWFNIHTTHVFIDDAYAPPNVDSQVYLHFCVKASAFFFSSLDSYKLPFYPPPLNVVLKQGIDLEVFPEKLCLRLCSLHTETIPEMMSFRKLTD